tara:strand:+ start:82 stop:894 length:813 start_codon:yes stop_codon:yes gene_type:complete
MGKVIILAGQGELPSIIIKNLLKKKIDFYTLIFTKKKIPSLILKYKFKAINFGKVVTELKKLRSLGFKDILMAGSLNRPNLSEIKPDINSIKLIPPFAKRLLQGGDNNLLSFAIKEIEKMGFRIITLKTLLPECFLGFGNHTNNKISKTSHEDIKKGKLILDNNSKFDIGQSIVVQEGNIIGIEAIQGTDNLIKYSSKFFKNGIKPTLIKLVKIKQDLRVDLPTIGMTTVKNCKNHFFGGIAFSANDTVFINSEKIVKYCDSNKLFLLGI